MLPSNQNSNAKVPVFNGECRMRMKSRPRKATEVLRVGMSRVRTLLRVRNVELRNMDTPKTIYVYLHVFYFCFLHVHILAINTGKKCGT